MTKNYLALMLLSRQPEIEALGEGSTGQTELSRQRLGDLLLLTPSLRVQEAFDKQTPPLRTRTACNEVESCTLSALRDALLPKLISGELRVKHTETSIEDMCR